MPEDLLSLLKRDLTAARASTEKTSFRCSETLAGLAGTPKAAILNALGEPDFVADSAKRRWSYFFVAPSNRPGRGGGFPTVTFTFNEGDVAISVSCVYAR